MESIFPPFTSLRTTWLPSSAKATASVSLAWAQPETNFITHCGNRRRRKGSVFSYRPATTAPLAATTLVAPRNMD